MRVELRNEFEEIKNSISILDIPNIGNYRLEAINAKANDLLSKVDLENIEKDEYEDFALIFWTKGSALNNLNKYEDAFNSYLKSYEIIKKSQNDFNLIEIKSLYGLAWSFCKIDKI